MPKSGVDAHRIRGADYSLRGAPRRRAQPCSPRVQDAAGSGFARQDRRARKVTGRQQFKAKGTQRERPSRCDQQRPGTQAIAIGTRQRERFLCGQDLRPAGGDTPAPAPMRAAQERPRVRQKQEIPPARGIARDDGAGDACSSPKKE